MDEAIVVASSLIKYQKEKGKSSKPNQGKGGEDKGKGTNNRDHNKSQQKKQNDGQKKGSNTQINSFVCKGPHRMKDCPKLGSLAALVKESDARVEETSAKIESLRLLNALKAKPLPKTTKGKGLMYMEGKMNERPIIIMSNIGATHNFITPKEAKRIGLNVGQNGGSLKTVNSPPKQLFGVTQDVKLCLGSKSGKVDFSIIHMDDFKVALGLNFLRKVHPYHIPYYNAICILEKGAT